MHDAGRTRSVIKVQSDGDRNGDERYMRSGKCLETKGGLISRYKKDFEYASTSERIIQLRGSCVAFL